MLHKASNILIYGCNVGSKPCICPTVRQGINSLSHSESRLKPTAENLYKQFNKQLNQQYKFLLLWSIYRSN